MSSSDSCIEKSEYGYWVYPRYGRGRFYPHGSTIAKKLDAGMQLENLDRTRRAFKDGTHEPVVYYRDADGRIGIPPEPDAPLPEGAIRHEACSLKDIDSLSREIRDEHYKNWQDHGEFTAMMDEGLGDPRKQLLDRMAATNSNFERDTIREILTYFDQEEANRSKIESDAYFHFREFDR